MDSKADKTILDSQAQMKLYVNYLYKDIYKEKPVDVLTFLRDDYYLGSVTRRGEAIYPGWLSPIEKIFSDDSKYLIVVTGSIGIGKTITVCGFCMPYIFYKVAELKNPWEMFEKTDTGKFDVSFFNLTKSLSGSKGFSYMQNSIMKSPWFRNQGGGRLHGSEANREMDLPLFNWMLASPYSKGFGTIGGNIITGVMDEIDSPNESEGQKKRVLQAYDATVRRFESRFVRNGESLGRLFLVASKQEELSFLEVFIEEMKHSNKVMVIDKAQWEIRGTKNYSGKWFFVSAGDAYNQPKIIEKEEEDKYLKDGFRVVKVPEEHKFEFERDVVGALRDLAGVSVKGIRLSKFIPSEKFIRECLDDTKPDPMDYETIEIGLMDDGRLIDHIDLGKIRTDLKTPRCTHADMGVTEDSLSLACSGVAGWVDLDVETEDGTFEKRKMPIVETDFVLRLKARVGDRIPLHSIRRFLIDLKAKGLNIRMSTFDLRLLSEDTIQLLNKANVTADYLSLDKNIKPYMDFRSMLYEGRWICHMHKWLFFELKNLEHDKKKNKVDHPDKVKELEFLEGGGHRDIVIKGSKDCADAVAGSVYNVIASGVHAADIQGHINALKALKKPTKNVGLPEDWFISDKSKKEAGGAGPVLGTGNVSTSNAAKMAEALKKIRRGRTGIL